MSNHGFIFLEQSVKSKVTFVDRSEWETLSVLLGLVSCPVRISLKADLILTLSTLVKPPPSIIAINFWQTLEASQIIVTVPTISSYQSRGIMVNYIYIFKMYLFIFILSFFL